MKMKKALGVSGRRFEGGTFLEWRGSRVERGYIEDTGRIRWVYVSCLHRGFGEVFQRFCF